MYQVFIGWWHITYCSFCCKWFIHRIILTFKVLNCFKDHRCSHILYHILDFVQQTKTRFTIEQPHMLPTLYCQYHSCWCPGDLSRHGISRNGFDQISWNIPCLASEQSTCIVSILLTALFCYNNLQLRFSYRKPRAENMDLERKFAIIALPNHDANDVHITEPLRVESTNFPWSGMQSFIVTVEQTMELLVIWDALMLMLPHCFVSGWCPL